MVISSLINQTVDTFSRTYFRGFTKTHFADLCGRTFFLLCIVKVCLPGSIRVGRRGSAVQRPGACPRRSSLTSGACCWENFKNKNTFRFKFVIGVFFFFLGIFPFTHLRSPTGHIAKGMKGKKEKK